MRPERSQPRAGAPRGRSVPQDEWSYDGPVAGTPRAGEGRGPRGDVRRDPRHDAPRSDRDPRRAPRRAAPQRGVAGALAVLGVFLVTLAAGAADSYLGVGLGLITTVGLAGSTLAAALLVRRRDLASVVVAPPLVFVGVALVNIVLAPSATFSLPTIATLLIRGFPAMAVAVAVALVVGLGRLVARR